MSHAGPSKSAPPPGIPNLDGVLANMDERAQSIEFPDERARLYNLAGDLCFDASARERALLYYGRAIDEYVGAELFDGAVGVCRKIVRLTPEVVRARCTLAWLALGQGLFDEAQQRIADYALAAANAGQEAVASQHLRLMTDLSQNREVLQSLAEALLDLGDQHGADKAFGAAHGHSAGSSMPQDEQARWAMVVRFLRGESEHYEAPETPTHEPNAGEQVAADEFAEEQFLEAQPGDAQDSEEQNAVEQIVDERFPQETFPEEHFAEEPSPEQQFPPERVPAVAAMASRLGLAREGLRRRIRRGRVRE
ncbi:MAG TPA: hypothetical protein VK864_15080 [Longimicrobiales bacterium]|nr:hypothetical protein [Longimicrobiales bacterium]